VTEAGSEVTLADVQAAQRAISGQVATTPCVHSRTLSRITGADVFLKLENLQFTSSFKERGALNRLLALSPAERAAGVIAMSAGNHAQGVAYHAARLGVPATIVMPKGTPFVKVENTRVLGATVVLEGEDVEAAAQHARALAAAHGYTFVHPYDDPAVIAGQGTIAIEMLAAVPDLEVLVVPIGGGGLIGGIATAAKALRPTVRVVGVEAALVPSMKQVLGGLPVAVSGTTIAEGIAVKNVGQLTRAIVARLVDDIMLVGEGDIERAVMLLLEIEKTVSEGAGATSLAALLAAPEEFRGRKVGLVVSGGNIDPRLLSSVILRGLARDGRLARLRLVVPDQPGNLARAAAIIGAAGANILEVYHERAFTALPIRATDLLFVIETRNAQHVAEVVAGLRSSGFAVTVDRAGNGGAEHGDVTP